MNRWDVEKEIAIKALKDPSFKEKLLKNPNKTIEGLLKGKEKEKFLKFKDELKIRVIEEKKNEWVISIPCPETLSEKELEKLAAAGTCDVAFATL